MMFHGFIPSIFAKKDKKLIYYLSFFANYLFGAIFTSANLYFCILHEILRLFMSNTRLLRRIFFTLIQYSGYNSSPPYLHFKSLKNSKIHPFVKSLSCWGEDWRSGDRAGVKLVSLGTHDSSKPNLGDIFGRRILLFPSVSVFFFSGGRAGPRWQCCTLL
jgi:hypothetical protein